MANEIMRALKKRSWKKFFFDSTTNVIRSLAQPNGISTYLELISPVFSQRYCYASITKIDHLDSDTVLISLKPNQLWRGNQAGQFVGIGVVIDGKRIRRYYSPLTSNFPLAGYAADKSESNKTIIIGVSRHPGGVVSNYLVDHARVGMVVSLSPAGGDFVLEEQLPDRLRFFSAGSGFTTVLSMLSTLVHEKYSGSVFIAHYGPTQQKIAVKKLFSSLAAQLHDAQLVFGLTQQESISDSVDLDSAKQEYVFGRVCPDHCGNFADPLVTTFACGPVGFVQAVCEITHPSVFHQEVFTPVLAAKPISEMQSYPVEINCAKSRICIKGDTNTTLLDAMLDADVNAEYGCKMGICYTCTVVKKAGVVRNIVTNDINEDPDVSIQLCVTAPQSDIEVEV